LVLALLVFDTCAVSSPLRRASNMRLSEMEIGQAPIPPGTRERKVVLPVSGIDGKWWIIHTEKMLREGAFRVRECSQDNSPVGREVHWSSGLMWLLAGFAEVLHSFSGQPLLDCVSVAALYSGPVILVLLMTVYAGFLARRFGWVAAGFGILFFTTCSPVLELFRAGNCDHHGLVGWFAMMSLFCLAAGGGGCVTQGRSSGRKSRDPGDGEVRNARRWVIASGIFGAAGLWVSAATQIPILAATALGGLIAGLVLRKSDEVILVPKLWVVWGAAGCAASMFFYLLEYFPFHMGWRLEVNHPLYALAWLGGGSLLARILTKSGGGPWIGACWKDRIWAAVCVVMAILPAMVIAWKRADVFWVSDHFLLALHNEHIGEFQPFFEAISGSAVGLIVVQSLSLPLLCLAGIGILGVRRIPRAWIAMLLVVFIPAFVMLGFGMRQIRWLGIALCLWSLLAALLAVLLLQCRGTVRRWQAGLLVLLCVPTIGIAPLLAVRGLQRELTNPQSIPKDLLPNVIARDVVQRILRANPGRPPVILSGPTTSTDLAYYGGTKMIGTLYWENMHGLKAAADIFSAPDAKTAKTKLAERGITHILLFSWDEFSQDYSELWGRRAPGLPTGEIFATRLLEGAEMPQWLRPLFYPIPRTFELEGESVSLFEIVPGQSRADSLAAQAIYRLDAGQYESALGLLRTARSEFPDDLRFSELLAEAEKAAARVKQPTPSAPQTNNLPERQ